MRSLRALLFPVGELPRVVVLPDTLEALREVVEGTIDAIRLDRRVSLICNDEFLLNDMPPNLWAVGPTYRGVAVHGPCLVVGFDPSTGEHESLTDEDLARYAGLPRLEWVTEGGPSDA